MVNLDSVTLFNFFVQCCCGIYAVFPTSITSLLLFFAGVLPLAIRFHEPLKAVKLLNNLSLRTNELQRKKCKMSGDGGDVWEESIAQHLGQYVRIR